MQRVCDLVHAGVKCEMQFGLCVPCFKGQECSRKCSSKSNWEWGHNKVQTDEFMSYLRGKIKGNPMSSMHKIAKNINMD